MTRFNKRRISAVAAAIALIVGLLLVWHGSTYQSVFEMSNLGLTQARGIYAFGLLQTALGLGALVIAFVSYRFARNHF